jgi:hypothetical protein
LAHRSTLTAVSAIRGSRFCTQDDFWISRAYRFTAFVSALNMGGHAKDLPLEKKLDMSLDELIKAQAAASKDAQRQRAPKGQHRKPEQAAV